MVPCSTQEFGGAFLCFGPLLHFIRDGSRSPCPFCPAVAPADLSRLSGHHSETSVLAQSSTRGPENIRGIKYGPGITSSACSSESGTTWKCRSADAHPKAIVFIVVIPGNYQLSASKVSRSLRNHFQSRGGVRRIPRESRLSTPSEGCSRFPAREVTRCRERKIVV